MHIVSYYVKAVTEKNKQTSMSPPGRRTFTVHTILFSTAKMGEIYVLLFSIKDFARTEDYLNRTQ